MNPYGMLHSSHNSLSLHDHNHLSRMLQIPVVSQQLSAPTITNSAMRALGSLSQQPPPNSIMSNVSPLSMGGAPIQDQHDNRIPVNQLDHHLSRNNNPPPQQGNSSTTTSNPSDSNISRQQNPPQPGTSSSTTLELHPDIVLDNFFEEHEDRPHVCQVCNACYKTRTHLKRHMCVHLKARPYTCNFQDCGKGFNRKGTEHLNKHQDAVHRLTKFKCNICSKEISRKDHLNRHIKNMHTFPLPPGGTRRGQGGGSSHKKRKGKQQQQQQDASVVEPKIETNRFQMNSSSNALGTPPHQHYHHPDFPNGKGGQSGGPGLLELFTCSECSASFVLESDLAIHTKTHKPQPYKCAECPRAYTRREKLTEHVRCFHQGLKFSCEYCGKDLSRKDHVLRHVRSVHPEVLASQFVELADNNGDPTNVINTKTSNTSNSGSTSTPTSSTPSGSTPSIGEMGALLKSVCHICLKVFGTSYHLARHVQSVHSQNVRPFSCSFCSKQFKRKDHLANHMKSHCPSHLEGSPAAGQLNPINSTLDINNLLSNNNGGDAALRQHALNSLQIEMLSPEDENKSNESGKTKEGIRRSSRDSPESPSNFKFPKPDKEEGQQRRSCDVLNIPMPSTQSILGMGLNSSLHHQHHHHQQQQQKRTKDSHPSHHQQQNSTAHKQHHHPDTSHLIGSEMNESRRTPPNTFCTHCQIKFNSDEEFHHHAQKHRESESEKEVFHGNLWGRSDHIQNQQQHNNRT